MTKTSHPVLLDVRQYVKDHEIDLSNIDGNPTLLGGIAKAVTLGLTGKNQKQTRDRVTTFLINVKGELDAAASAQSPEPVSDFDGSLDDFRTESDEAQNSLMDDAQGFDGNPTDEAEEADVEGDEAPEPGSEEGDEDEAPAGEKSVVKSKYRQGYKQRGNARGNNDWMHRMLEGLTLGAKRKLNYPAFAAIAEANDCSEDLAKFATAEKQLTNGWQGRARMSAGICLRIKVARNGSLAVPRALWEVGKARLEATNSRALAEGGNAARFVEWTIDEGEDEGDEVVFLRPAGDDKGFFDAVIAKHEGNKKALAEGRKAKPKQGRID